VELQTLCRFASNSFVLRNNFFLNHLPRLVVKRVNNIYVCTVNSSFTRHEKKVTLFAVSESKSVNRKAVVNRNAVAGTFTSADRPDAGRIMEITRVKIVPCEEDRVKAYAITSRGDAYRTNTNDMRR
jgi:hypothetical protein